MGSASKPVHKSSVHFLKNFSNHVSSVWSSRLLVCYITVLSFSFSFSFFGNMRISSLQRPVLLLATWSSSAFTNYSNPIHWFIPTTHYFPTPSLNAVCSFLLLSIQAKGPTWPAFILYPQLKGTFFFRVTFLLFNRSSTTKQTWYVQNSPIKSFKVWVSGEDSWVFVSFQKFSIKVGFLGGSSLGLHYDVAWTFAFGLHECCFWVNLLSNRVV